MTLSDPTIAAKPARRSQNRFLIYRLAAAYLLLLALSHAYWLIGTPPNPNGPGQQSLRVPERSQEFGIEPGTALDTSAGADRPVSISYYDGGEARGPIVLLIHGSPAPASMALGGYIAAMARFARVIAPDLPGFGYSTRKVPDYSARAHALYMIEMLNALKIDRAHLVAYSMGGAVAIELARLAPTKVASVTMLSAIGVQEFELLGNYHLNHALHGAQLVLIRLAQALLPHFGGLERFPLNVGYARNFYDTDQRPLRGYLRQYRAPMLILHGSDDLLVPATAAREHHRIVPQSEIKWFPGGHLAMFERTQEITAAIRDFIERVEASTSATRDQAEIRRKRDAQKSFAEVERAPAEGLLLIFYLVVIALATLVSEDLACIGAGLMAAHGIIDLVYAIIGSFAGIVIGDVLLFLAGRYLGRPALGYPPLKWMIKATDIDRYSRWFDSRGPALIIASRFLPGSRLPTYFCAGLLGRRLVTFTIYFCIASFLWTPALVGLSAFTGEQLQDYYQSFEQHSLWVAATTLLLVWLILKFVVPLVSRRVMKISSWYMKRYRNRP